MANKIMKTLTMGGNTYEVTDGYARDEINTLKNSIQSGAVKTTLGDLGITATANEINVLDGVTATVTEINKLKGLTSSTYCFLLKEQGGSNGLRHL